MFSKPTAHINLAALRHNARIAKQLAPASKLLAVVKANAYGHGAPEVTRALSDIADGFAVARFDEAISLRNTVKQKPILILGGIYNNHELDSCLLHQINVVVHQDEQLALLCNHKTERQQKITVWLKIDTGMHRLGISPEDVSDYFQKLRHLNFIQDVVVMTHLASSEDAASPMANQQLQTFQTCIHTLPKTTSNITTSIANSGGVIYWKESHGDWIRPGLMLYGIQPDISRPIDLQPVMTLDTPIIAMRHVVAGEAVGYNQTWRAKRDSVIATVCLGYGDGYPTQITLATPVMIRGQRAAIVGRVSMDLITIDVTDLPQTRTGDRVMFWGQDSNGNKLSVEEIAKCAGTIPYDLVSKIGGRVKYNFI